MNNLFAAMPTSLPTELFETLLETPSLRIERIISQGHTTASEDWYDQSQNEWVVLLQGAARLQFEDEPHLRELKPGDYINIASGVRHRVAWTAPDETTLWLAIHYGNR